MRRDIDDRDGVGVTIGDVKGLAIGSEHGLVGVEAHIDFVGCQWLGFGDVDFGDVGPALGGDERLCGVLGEGHPNRAVSDVGCLNLVGGEVDDGDGVSELVCHDEAFTVFGDSKSRWIKVDLLVFRADDWQLKSSGFHELAAVEVVRADLVVDGSAGK